ncbi:RNA polymerase sigma factor SigJ [Massilia antarctica]|uniref:RNA polymerase sigma factor SigJ n=1 Tax=Massilia antarctica TaxID=2765360 RepID=A0AA48W930_9BURK|nr:RNA polymerase sigma factor SigJ [Massilia antarctica]QPI48281.1 RNA polymerase sigma factor SigJ [Massilia antarctica]
MTDTFTIQFHQIRPRLFGIAYRMLGSRADADDAVQDTWLRWNANDTRADLASADAWLVTVTTRLCIDRLRSAIAEREAYIGPWLAEPIVTRASDLPESRLELAGDMSMAFMLMLERLGPEERAVFLLHEVFDCDYADIAAAVDKTEAACRQLLHRARERVRAGKPRFAVSEAAHMELLGRFVTAAQSGERVQLAQLFAPDATFRADGGGKVSATINVVRGADKIARFYESMARKYGAATTFEHAIINGQPGLLRLVDGRLDSTMSFDMEDGRIAAIYVVRNPDKLARAS